MMYTPDTKDGRLLTGTHWFPAGTEVRDVRLTLPMVKILRDSLGVADGAPGQDPMAIDLYSMLGDLEPDAMNDFTL